jgi:hypothetical protein
MDVRSGLMKRRDDDRVIRTPNWLHCPATRQGAFQDAGKKHSRTEHRQKTDSGNGIRDSTPPPTNATGRTTQSARVEAVKVAKQVIVKDLTPRNPTPLLRTISFPIH